MANYPVPISERNPFFTDYPIVMAVRHVRRVGDELVAEDANDLPRSLHRIPAKRADPQRVSPARSIERNVPFNDTQKVSW